jgi:hypothetical protein
MWRTAREAEGTNATGLTLQVERFTKYAPLRLEGIKETLIPREGRAWRLYNPPLNGPSTWLVGGLLLAASLLRLIRLRSPTDAYVLLTFLMLALWPWDEGVRLVSPLMPLFAGVAAWTAMSAWRRSGTSRRWKTCVAAAVLAILALQFAELPLTYARQSVWRDKSRKRLADTREIADWLETHTTADTKWLGITPDGSPSKNLMLGAAYLSRRPVHTIDTREATDWNALPAISDCILIHAGLATRLHENRALVPAGKVADFNVLIKTHAD